MNILTKIVLTAVGTLAVVVGGMYYLHPHVKTLAELKASAVSLTMETGATCSGWILAESHKVITAAHCVSEDAPDAKVQVDFHDGTGKHLFKTDKIGTVVGDKPDLAVLTPLPNEKIKWPQGLSVCPFKPYDLEQLIMIGDPLGYRQAVTLGRVSNPSQVVDGARAAPYIQYDGSLSPGNSGGPLLDVKYQCVIASADALIQSMAGSAVNFLEPAHRLYEIL